MPRSRDRNFHAVGRFAKMREAIHISKIALKRANTATFISVIALLLSLLSFIHAINSGDSTTNTETQEENR